MSATTPTQQQITHIETGAGYGGGLTSIKSYSEFMLNKMMFDKILNTKNSMEFTPANIGKLMLIMCAPDIKTLVIEAGKYLASIVKESPQYLFTVLKYIYKAIQSLKQGLVYGLSGKWLTRRKSIDFRTENLENSGGQSDMWETAENYSLTVDNIFIAELIKFIETHKHKHTKSCIGIKIDGVNITRQYMLADAIIDWVDDTNQAVQISINNNINFMTSAKLTNSANETLVNLYELPNASGTNSDAYVFPPELGITEYWDLLSNPIFKNSYPFMEGDYIIPDIRQLIYKTSICALKNLTPSIDFIYKCINKHIAKQNFKVFGIPNANPDITNHCLTLLMIYMHLGCEDAACYYKTYLFDCYTINPFLININLDKFMKNIKQLFIANLFDDLMKLKAKDMSKEIIQWDKDVFWAPTLGGVNKIYASDKDNNIAFSKPSKYIGFYIPLILNKKINRLHVTQERFDKFMTDNSLENQVKSCKETKLLSLDILLKTKTPSVNPAIVLTKFLETIRANSVSLNTTCSNSVPVKYIKLKQTETTTESDNPAYKEWVKKKDLILSNLAPVSANSAPISNQGELINSNHNSNPNSNSNGVIQSSAAVYTILPSLVDSMPPEKLVTTKTGFVIDEQTINQTCRQMQSLSIKSKDKKKLMHALDDYLEDGPTLKAWGIKNKLNILLYGEPGTGKSSTIEAIATYLNKPIYYVDMKEARTNNDLKLIFDHVNSVAVGGGIIVMEDIDAMTTCVHKRISSGEPNGARTDIINDNSTTDTNTTVSAIMAEKETNTLTLEFFLNILDGVLTADKSIFITTTNHIENLDPAFYRAGRFNLKIELGACNHDQMNYIYKNMRGQEIPTELLRRIPEKVFKPAEFIFHIKDYVRDPTLTDAEILEPFMTK